jgi:hypothetical protein
MGGDEEMKKEEKGAPPGPAGEGVAPQVHPLRPVVEVRRLDETVHLLVIAVRNLQTAISPDARVELWRRLQMGYCPNCGDVTEWICHCENDE